MDFIIQYNVYSTYSRLTDSTFVISVFSQLDEVFLLFCEFTFSLIIMCILCFQFPFLTEHNPILVCTYYKIWALLSCINKSVSIIGVLYRLTSHSRKSTEFHISASVSGSCYFASWLSIMTSRETRFKTAVTSHNAYCKKGKGLNDLRGSYSSQLHTN